MASEKQNKDSVPDLLVEGLESLVRDPKQLADFSQEADTLLPSITSLSLSSATLDEAINIAMHLEKKARQAYDAVTCSRVCCHLLSILFDKYVSRESIDEDESRLFVMIPLMIKKRGQLKKTILNIVQHCMHWVFPSPSSQSVSSSMDVVKELTRESRYKLIRLLTGVTEGKLFLEAERARLKKLESSMKEEEGLIDEATALIQEEQVEVCVTMGKREKTEYILEQMRLVLLKKDFIRLQIASRRINTKLLDKDTEIADLRERYYRYMIEYWLNEGDYLEVAKCYQSLLQPHHVDDYLNSGELIPKLIYYLFLASPATSEPERSHMLKNILIDLKLRRKMERNFQEGLELVKSFLSDELIDFENTSLAKMSDSVILRKRVVQHNLLKVISVYYSLVSFSSLSEILKISLQEVEEEISELVSCNVLHAKIDRPAGLINFDKKTSAKERLDIWSAKFGEVLDLVEATTHLIQKEEMVYAAKEKLRLRQVAAS